MVIGVAQPDRHLFVGAVATTAEEIGAALRVAAWLSRQLHVRRGACCPADVNVDRRVDFAATALAEGGIGVLASWGVGSPQEIGQVRIAEAAVIAGHHLGHAKYGKVGIGNPDRDGLARGEAGADQADRVVLARVGGRCRQARRRKGTPRPEAQHERQSPGKHPQQCPRIDALSFAVHILTPSL